MLGKTVYFMECAALKWLQTVTAPSALPLAVVLTQRAEDTH